MAGLKNKLTGLGKSCFVEMLKRIRFKYVRKILITANPVFFLNDIYAIFLLPVLLK